MQTKLNIILLQHTPLPENIIAMGARLCYSKSHIEELEDKVCSKDQTSFVQKIMDMGHDSVLEHVTFTFGIEGVSRVLLAQLTRHRMASFSVQSQRYVSYENGFGYVIPPSIKALGDDAVHDYEHQMEQMHQWYVDWQKRLGSTGEGSNEDARFVLPGACETRLMMTMNVRELRHFFSLRMCNRAQWEIRQMATEMHRLCMEVAPALFYDAGAPCLSGQCPEGEKSCGKARQIRKERCRMLDEFREAQGEDD